MDLWPTIPDVIILLAAALLLGLLFERFKQSTVVGYLIAGTLLGPGAFNLIENETAIRTLAELGVALLLFTIGLEFSWTRLRSLGAVALVGGTLQLLLTGLLFALAAKFLGASSRTALAFGLVLGPSSTACVLRMLAQRAELESVHGRSTLGILLLQDMALVPAMLAIVVLGGEGPAGQIVWKVLKEIGLGACFVVLFVLLTNVVFPRLFDAVVMARNRELPILLAVTTFLAATWGSRALGLSPVLGAFVAGVLLAESPYATWIRADVSVLRTLFVTLFFASIGMLDDLEWIGEHWHWLLAAVPGILLVKAGIVALVCRLLRVPLRHAIAAGLCLAQTGEFSFVLADSADSAGLFNEDQFRLIVATTVVTLVLTPYLVRVAPRVGAWCGHSWRPGTVSEGRRYQDAEEDRSGSLRDHVIIVGFGPAGRTAANMLRAAGLDLAVVDMNARTVAKARAEGIHAVVGDATQEVVLEKLHVTAARAVVITIPDHRALLEVIGQVRAAAPDVAICARARYGARVPELEARGIRAVDEETEAGHRIGLTTLEQLGLGSRPDGPKTCDKS